MKKMVLYASNSACVVMLFMAVAIAPILFLRMSLVFGALIGLGLFFGLFMLSLQNDLLSPAYLQQTPWPTILMVPILLYVGITGTRMLPLTVGIPLLIFVIVFGVQWMFYGAREGWQTFADKHGLQASGLEAEGVPRLEGEWRGVPITVELLFDPKKLGVSEENVSITLVKAHFTQEVSIQEQNEEVALAISIFLQTYPDFGEVDESGVSTADYNLLEPHPIEAMLDHCVDTLLVLQKHTTD